MLKTVRNVGCLSCSESLQLRHIEPFCTTLLRTVTHCCGGQCCRLFFDCFCSKGIYEGLDGLFMPMLGVTEGLLSVKHLRIVPPCFLNVEKVAECPKRCIKAAVYLGISNCQFLFFLSDPRINRLPFRHSCHKLQESHLYLSSFIPPNYLRPPPLKVPFLHNGPCLYCTVPGGHERGMYTPGTTGRLPTQGCTGRYIQAGRHTPGGM